MAAYVNWQDETTILNFFLFLRLNCFLVAFLSVLCPLIVYVSFSENHFTLSNETGTYVSTIPHKSPWDSDAVFLIIWTCEWPHKTVQSFSYPSPHHTLIWKSEKNFEYTRSQLFVGWGRGGDGHVLIKKADKCQFFPRLLPMTVVFFFSFQCY